VYPIVLKFARFFVPMKTDLVLQFPHFLGNN